MATYKYRLQQAEQLARTLRQLSDNDSDEDTREAVQALRQTAGHIERIGWSGFEILTLRRIANTLDEGGAKR